MKVNILYKITDGPWGGGNQFLKGLKGYLEKAGVYEEDPEKADAILLNSHHSFREALSIKFTFPKKVIVHRVDGPVFLVRGKNREIDSLIFEVNSSIADGTVFQSNWSRAKCLESGMRGQGHETIILNAPDPEVFYPKEKKEARGGKTNIIATSWSANMKKGFNTYKFLDENLDFERFGMTFVGNSPFAFKNIKHVKPVQSRDLADMLRGHDIFITASMDDPCSNSLIEALHCGLPAVALNSGGHPEIVGKGGVVFSNDKDVIGAIEAVQRDYWGFLRNINLPHINDIGKRYYDFIVNIHNETKNNVYTPRKLSYIKASKLSLRLRTIETIAKMTSHLESLSSFIL